MNIIIRPISIEDTSNILKWRNNESVMENFIFQSKLTEETHLKWFSTKVQTGEVAQFIIEDDESKIDIGSIYLRDIDRINNKAEFGIFIGENMSRGKGFGAMATKLILEYAFANLTLNKVFLRVFSDNINAIRTYKKAGFIEEGIFKDDVYLNGVYRDLVFMAIRKCEWENRNE